MKNVNIIAPAAPSKENLKAAYDVINKIFKNSSVYYTAEEIKKLKKDKNNVFL